MTTAIIATTPQQMQEAQSTTLAWVSRKIETVKHELADARATFTTLQAAKFNTNRATAMIRRASRRITFYEKIHAALEAGYVIIPPFDVQIFAVRTDRAPKRFATRLTSAGARYRWVKVNTSTHNPCGLRTAKQWSKRKPIRPRIKSRCMKTMSGAMQTYRCAHISRS
jgi:hypothetical protein